jgi:hypothetical protein
MRSHSSGGTLFRSPDKDNAGRGAPGKRTMVQDLPLQASPARRFLDSEVPEESPVRRSAEPGAEEAADASREEQVVEKAEAGLSGAASAVPHQEQMEQSFGTSFGHVQAHTDENAQQACAALGANAFAMGDHVAFKNANPDPGLVAHELTHVVQQSGNLRPQAAVGTPGDAYEQEADAVAARVVQGQSVAPMLSHHTGKAAGERAAVQGDNGLLQLEGPGDADPKKDPGKGDKGGGGNNEGGINQELEDTLEAIASQYSFICLRQRDAVDDLNKDAQKEDPPPLWQSILIGAAELALTAALGGVGGVIVKSIGSKLAGKVSEMTAEFVANAVSDFAKDAGARAVKGGIGALAASTKDPRELFFRGQRDALTQTAAQQQAEFLRTGRAKIRKADKPLDQANALYAAIQENLQNAYEKQRDESLDAWCSYQAKGDLGEKEIDGKKKGTNLDDQLGDTSAVGVIGIEIRCKQPGARPEIERAEVEGLNEGLRGILESRPIGSIKAPITVKGYVGDDVAWYEKQPWMQVGRNEQGVVWVDDNYDMHWLYYRANPNPELWGPGGRPRTKLVAGALDGARMLVEKDMKDLTLSGKLSG